MELTAAEIGAIRQYLLGRLAPEQWTPLEERLLTDGDFHDELSIAEDELIDRYLAGDLAAEDRETFETHFLLAPERQKKLRFARALRRYVAAEAASAPHAASTTADDLRQNDSAVTVEHETRGGGDAVAPLTPDKKNFFKLLFGRRPALAFSLAALLLVAAVSWLAVRRTPRFEPRNPHTVALAHGLVRGGSGELTRVGLPAEADALRLRLELPADDHPTYRAELQTAEGRAVHASDALKAVDAAGARVVEVDVPAESVPAGDYRVRLGGETSRGATEPVASYAFRVVGR
jgi:hypothetical protein